jgi:hypothetical protein
MIKMKVSGEIKYLWASLIDEIKIVVLDSWRWGWWGLGDWR